MNFIEGEILLFDKPYTWTSFSLVKKVRYLIQKHLGIKNLKVGHTGTLDPLATGLMILCTGRSTKLIESIQSDVKEYIATIGLGKTTPCFDLEKDFDGEYPVEHITQKLIESALENFKGEIDQVPPVFSAKNVDGKRAYSYARKGTSIEMKPNKVTIHNIEIINFDLPTLTLNIKCSKGTYIRSLARDIGLALESGAHLAGLRRTASGNYNIKDAMNIDVFQEKLLSLQTK